MGMVHLIPPYCVESNPAQEGTQENHPWAISISVLPFASEAQYREYVDDPAQYRQYLSEMLSQYPELFPNGMDQDLPFTTAYASVKQDLIMRRIKLIIQPGPSSPCAPRSSCPT